MARYPKLTLDIGLRYDWTGIPQPPVVNPLYPATGVIPGSPVNIAPRLGFAYSLGDKTVIRGGYGLFNNRYPTSTIENITLSNGIIQSSYSLQASTPAQLLAGPVFPNFLAMAPTVGASATSIVVASPNFRNPYSEQATLAIERELFRNTSLTVSYVWSRGLVCSRLATPTSLSRTSRAHRELRAETTEGCYGYPVLDASGSQVEYLHHACLHRSQQDHFQLRSESLN